MLACRYWLPPDSVCPEQAGVWSCVLLVPSSCSAFLVRRREGRRQTFVLCLKFSIIVCLCQSFWNVVFCTMCMRVTVAYRCFLPVIDDNMRDLIELFRRPFSKMIPGACLPIIDCLCLRNPGRKV